MSINPDMEAWKRRFAVCLVVALTTLMLTGAKEVTQEWRLHQNHLTAVNRRALVWVEPRAAADSDPGMVVASTASGERSRAVAGTVALDNGLFLLKACSRPMAGR